MAPAKPVLQVVIGSTRPGRVGGAVAQWFYDLAQNDEGFEVELIDLAVVNLPLYDEPRHPMRQQYAHEHTKHWSLIVGRADALVFVIPEYNNSMNAAVKNAIDYLYHEWRYKPFGLVSYGGGSRGLRAAQALKLSLVALKMPFAGDVGIGLAQTPVVDGVFAANEQLAASAGTLLEELARLTPLFQSLRA
ncbi:MAG TPA: NAD(P)H-dependent oxidoreductase [Acidimicrobiales bacterium]|nr:NAD(P)H-dependent oxidoreductase [Acidimicrobiales bacterium]